MHQAAPYRRLTQPEIYLLRRLAQCGAAARPISLPKRLRAVAAPLWRIDLVEVWYRQAPEAEPSLQGPYYGLTLAGHRRALPFLSSSAAPRKRRVFSSSGVTTA